MRLDMELEKAVGRKERALGALRQQVREHKCWPFRDKVPDSRSARLTYQ
jgi:hypothetical protein